MILWCPVVCAVEQSSLEFLSKLGQWKDEKRSVIKKQHSVAGKVIIFATLYFTDHETLAQSLPLPP